MPTQHCTVKRLFCPPVRGATGAAPCAVARTTTANHTQAGRPTEKTEKVKMPRIAMAVIPEVSHQQALQPTPPLGACDLISCYCRVTFSAPPAPACCAGACMGWPGCGSRVLHALAWWLPAGGSSACVLPALPALPLPACLCASCATLQPPTPMSHQHNAPTCLSQHASGMAALLLGPPATAATADPLPHTPLPRHPHALLPSQPGCTAVLAAVLLSTASCRHTAAAGSRRTAAAGSRPGCSRRARRRSRRHSPAGHARRGRRTRPAGPGRSRARPRCPPGRSRPGGRPRRPGVHRPGRRSRPRGPAARRPCRPPPRHPCRPCRRQSPRPRRRSRPRSRIRRPGRSCRARRRTRCRPAARRWRRRSRSRRSGARRPRRTRWRRARRSWRRAGAGSPARPGRTGRQRARRSRSRPCTWRTCSARRQSPSRGWAPCPRTGWRSRPGPGACRPHRPPRRTRPRERAAAPAAAAGAWGACLARPRPAGPRQHPGRPGGRH
mmetsp:Transcript_14392/g.35694  ORF Transcript_14392/g.35694 Transcript_14392/m.35694 type:complete len:496 (-) Transcript_14392:1701-3188(-)